jgi:inner membrane protein
MRWLSPFSDRWTYGDTLFIVDPWLWLLLGGGLFLGHEGTARAMARWAAVGFVTSVPIFLGPVPPVAKLLWAAGLMALVLLRLRAAELCRRHERSVATAAVLASVAYIALMLALSFVARRHVLAELERSGFGPVEALMVGPMPVDPFEREVVVEGVDGYRFGAVRFAPTPRFELFPGQEPRRRRPSGSAEPVALAALADPSIRGFVGWARFPFVEVERRPDGAARVWVLDARYTRAPPAGGRGFGAAFVDGPGAKTE